MVHFIKDESMKEEKKRNKGLTKKKQRLLEKKIRKLIGQGFSDFEIQEKTGHQPHVIKHYQKRILEKDKAIFRDLTPETVMSSYARQRKQDIADLNRLINASKKKGKLTIEDVQAIKLKNRIENKVIKTGNELGLISRRTREIDVDGFLFEKKSRTDIKQAVEDEAKLMIEDLLFG